MYLPASVDLHRTFGNGEPLVQQPVAIVSWFQQTTLFHRFGQFAEQIHMPLPASEVSSANLQYKYHYVQQRYTLPFLGSTASSGDQSEHQPLAILSLIRSKKTPQFKMGYSAGDYQQTTASLESETDFQIKPITQTMKDPRTDQET